MKKLLKKASARWQTICTTWLGVYPLLTLLAWLLEPVLTGVHPALRSLVMSMLMVPVMVLLIMPGMQWITARLSHQSSTNNS